MWTHLRTQYIQVTNAKKLVEVSSVSVTPFVRPYELTNLRYYKK